MGLSQERSYCGGATLGVTPGEELLWGYLRIGAIVGLLQERCYCGATPGEVLLCGCPGPTVGLPLRWATKSCINLCKSEKLF